MSLRIALVYRSFQLTGSLSRATVQLARHLSAHHEVHVFSIPERTDRALAPNCHFHGVSVPHLGDGRRFSARELLPFARHAAALLSRERFDVIHTCAPSTWVADVLHVPGVARDEAVLQGVPRWRYAAQAARRPGDAVRRVLERKAIAFRGLRRIHAASESVRGSLARHYGIDPNKVLVVLPAVDLDEFTPPKDKSLARGDIGITDPSTLVLIFCGAAFHRKGLDRAILALAGIRENSLLLVIGSGADERYRQLADECGVSNRVRFLGERHDPARFYQAADMLLLPTRADVWGVTPIEAMACGVPPIVSSAAGSSESVTNQKTGVVLPEPFELTELQNAIEWLAADPARGQTIARDCLSAAREHAWSKRAQLVEEDLLALVEGRTEAGPIRAGRRRR